MHTEEYTLVEELEAPGEPGGPHLIDYQTQELISKLWSKYLAKARDGIAPSSVGPVARRVATTLEAECFPGDALKVGIKVVARTNRGFTFNAAIWHAGDGRFVCLSEIVTVTVDTAAGGAVAIPADLWANVETMEGKAIAVTERAAS